MLGIRTILGLAAAVLMLPAESRADACGPRLVVTFVEDASDIFVLQNASDPGWVVQRVEIDLRETGGGLIFDVTDAGAGVSGWQPYAPAGGTAVAVGRTAVTDGDRLLNMAFGRFDPGERFEFTIDLDDTLPGGTQTWIDGGEIAGGRVHAVFGGPDGTTAERSATFERDTRADTGRHENCLMS